MVSSNPSPMTISTSTAGSDPNPVANNSTSYTLVSLIAGQSIIGSLNSNMPAGVTLNVQLQAPIGATSAGSVTMSSTSQNLVTNIPTVSGSSNFGITYTLSATALAVPVTNGTRTLTLTLQ